VLGDVVTSVPIVLNKDVVDRMVEDLLNMLSNEGNSW
jgi:hypothetical protein